jgi:hypothetical protein
LTSLHELRQVALQYLLRPFENCQEVLCRSRIAALGFMAFDHFALAIDQESTELNVTLSEFTAFFRRKHI